MAYKVLLFLLEVFNLKEIGIKLKEKRKANGVSIKEAAEDLNLDEDALENMEEGNIRAFKDMYILKELIKDYSKYLGMDVNDVVEEFNDFLFEHTSKISVKEIEEVKSMMDDVKPKKIVSPYTKIPKPKRDFSFLLKPLLIGFLILLVFVLLFLIFNQEEKRSVELKNIERGVIYG